MSFIFTHANLLTNLNLEKFPRMKINQKFSLVIV